MLAVVTGADLAAAGVKPMAAADAFKRSGGRSLATPPRRALAHEFARYVGEPVAMVVAESREAARDAAEAIVVDYEEQPAVTTAVAATEPGAALVTPEGEGNIAAEMRHGDAAAAEAAFARAAPFSSRAGT